MPRSLIPFALALVACFCLASPAPSSSPTLMQIPPEPSPYGSCHGNVTGIILTCTPQDCPGGCYKRTVQTAFGPAKVCACSYIGPDPGCCTIALTSIGSYTAWGNCHPNGPCPVGELCSTFPDEGGGVTALCLP